MNYIIKTNEDGSRQRVYEKPEPKSAAHFIYQSEKPMNIGINRAKRIARAADKRDRALVVKTLGGGLPKEAKHHTELVQARHRYYHDAHDELVRSQANGEVKP